MARGVESLGSLFSKLRRGEHLGEFLLIAGHASGPILKLGRVTCQRRIVGTQGSVENVIVGCVRQPGVVAVQGLQSATADGAAGRRSALQDALASLLSGELIAGRLPRLFKRGRAE